jgi:Serine endopeptidase inhibitors
MKQQKKQSPYFAKFLESQQITNKTEVAGGGDPTAPLQDLVQTQKYPSDVEDLVSLKYPSDEDENNVTLKYPSDDDEGGVLL